MAGTQVVDQIQLGNNGTPGNNFVIKTMNDGTMKIQRGNIGGSLTDILTIDANGNPTFVGKVAQAVQSMVRVNTANGFGSTNTGIRRYSNVVVNQGTDITYADSATLGSSFTINTSGVYSISASEQANSTACWIALGLSPPSLTVLATTLPTNNTLVINTNQAGTGYPTACSWTGYLAAGSVIYPFTAGAAAGGQANGNTLTITRVA